MESECLKVCTVLSTNSKDSQLETTITDDKQTNQSIHT
jgi:hypothetical protein